MEPKGPTTVRTMDDQPKTEAKLTSPELVSFIAEISHRTWMSQAHKYKGTPLDQLKKEPFPDDHKRAADALKELEEKKPKTRVEALSLVAASSHNMWVEFQVGLGKQKDDLDLNPNDHDRERAEDIVKALEVRGVLSFS